VRFATIANRDDAQVGLETGAVRTQRDRLAARLFPRERARDSGVPASLLSGAVDSAALPRLSEFFSGCFSPAPGPITLETAIRDAARLLANEAEQLTRLRFGSI